MNNVSPIDNLVYFGYYVQHMHIVNISASELKKNVSDVLNDVYFDKKTAVIKRYGKIIAKIVPVDKASENTGSILDKYFGSLPNFPDVVKERSFQKRSIKL